MVILIRFIRLLVILLFKKLKLICLDAVKQFQVLLCNTNKSISSFENSYVTRIVLFSVNHFLAHTETASTIAI